MTPSLNANMNFSDMAFGFWRRPRLPLHLQTEAAECGLACLAMIAGFHGKDGDLGSLRRRFAVSLKGLNLRHLIGIADRLGFAARPVRLELHELPLLAMPCILHWDLNHFVVLRSANAQEAVIHDPAQGVRRLTPAELSAHFSGVAVELTPVGGFETQPPTPRLRLRALLGHIVGLKEACGQLFALALTIEILAVLSPFFLQWVVDHALLTNDRDLLLTLALGFGLLLVLRTVIGAMRGGILIRLSATLRVQGRINLFSHLIGLPAAYFETRHLGDVMSRFGSQEAIMQAITADAVEVVLDGLFTVVTLCIMFVFAPRLATLVLLGALVYALLRWLSYTPLRQASMEGIVWSARRDSHFLETLRGIKTIKLFNGQDGRRARWLNLLIESVNHQTGAQQLRQMFVTLNAFIVGILAIAVIWLGASSVLDQAMSVGMLLAFIAYKDQFLGRISKLIDKLVDIAMLRLHAERLADIALTPPEQRLDDEVLPSPPSSAQAPVAIEVRRLSFWYGEQESPVLDNVDFAIAAGESVAIAGASGCGKTTLLKILASLLHPRSGEILVDGRPLAQVGLANWRAMIGVVMQDDHLFSGSIADNICFFAEQPDLRQIERCARLAAVHEEIAAMPMGYSTLIGDMGTVLSGGQKQRVLIARALYRQPRLLLFDEATSHLDVGA
ncbi:MAG TPA: peptidase domain-containing ABC transporter, partial [Azospira sp.]|nr:peptidase domain-containing ABC transporter [Azospira sp.]